MGAAEKRQVWPQCGYPGKSGYQGKNETREGRQAPDQQGFLRRNWDFIPKGDR